jgi:hypothetical protein
MKNIRLKYYFVSFTLWLPVEYQPQVTGRSPVLLGLSRTGLHYFSAHSVAHTYFEHKAVLFSLINFMKKTSLKNYDSTKSGGTSLPVTLSCSLPTELSKR